MLARRKLQAWSRVSLRETMCSVDPDDPSEHQTLSMELKGFDVCIAGFEYCFSLISFEERIFSL